jgi:hypothetical protein
MVPLAMLWNAIGRARRETFAAIGSGRSGTIAFGVLALAAGCAIYFEEGGAPSSTADWVWLCLWSLVYAAFLMFFYNLWLAPYRIQKERTQSAENTIKALRAENEQLRLAAMPAIKFGNIRQERLALSEHVTLYKTYIEIFNTSTSFGLDPCSVKVQCLVDEDGVREPHSALSVREGGESFYLGPQEKRLILIATRQYQFGNAGKHVLQTKSQNYGLDKGKKCVLDLLALGRPSAPDRVSLSLSVDARHNLVATRVGEQFEAEEREEARRKM